MGGQSLQPVLGSSVQFLGWCREGDYEPKNLPEPWGPVSTLTLVERTSLGCCLLRPKRTSRPSWVRLTLRGGSRSDPPSSSVLPKRPWAGCFLLEGSVGIYICHPMLTLYVTKEIRECILLINNSNNAEDDFCFWPRWRKEIGYTVSTLNKRINRRNIRYSGFQTLDKATQSRDS